MCGPGLVPRGELRPTAGVQRGHHRGVPHGTGTARRCHRPVVGAATRSRPARRVPPTRLVEGGESGRAGVVGRTFGPDRPKAQRPRRQVVTTIRANLGLFAGPPKVNKLAGKATALGEAPAFGRATVLGKATSRRPRGKTSARAVMSIAAFGRSR